MLRNPFLKEIEITCSLKRDLNWWSRNIKWNLSTIVIMSFSNKLMRWISTRASSTTRRISYERKSSSRDSDSKYARDGRNEEHELRVDEFSVQVEKVMKPTIQRLTSQVQDLQGRMNYRNDSGEFQEVESNYSVKLSHVPSQPPKIAGPRLCWAATNAFYLTHGILLDDSKTFLSIHVRHLSHLKYFTREFIHSTTPGATGSVPVHIGTGTCRKRWRAN